MRLRYLENGHEILKNHERIIFKPESFNGQITRIFQKDNPVYLEIGTGKGKFLRESALLNPEINFLGMEMNTKVIGRCLQLFEEQHYANLYILHAKAEMLDKIFDKKTVDRIYINFTDPWTKEKHKKRRLTSQGFLQVYENILKNKGEIHIKTDSRELYNFSIKTLNQRGWIIGKISENLYTEPEYKKNIVTEYEEKFVKMGKSIFFILAKYSALDNSLLDNKKK